MRRGRCIVGIDVDDWTEGRSWGGWRADGER